MDQAAVQAVQTGIAGSDSAFWGIAGALLCVLVGMWGFRLVVRHFFSDCPAPVYTGRMVKDHTNKAGFWQ